MSTTSSTLQPSSTIPATSPTSHRQSFSKQLQPSASFQIEPVNKTDESETLAAWVKDRDKQLQKRDGEIRRLKEKNLELMEQLKRLSKQVDDKMSKIKVKKQDYVDPSTLSMKILNELECLKKLSRIYQNEVSNLKGRLNGKTGYEKVMEIDKKITQNKEKYEELLNEKRELEKHVKEGGKVLNKEDYRKENGIPQFEEGKLLTLQQKENAKTQQLQKRLVQEQECIAAKEGKIKELEVKNRKLENEVTELKTQATQIIGKGAEESKVEPNTGDKEIDKGKMTELQVELETEKKKNTKEKQSLASELDSLKAKYKDLEQRNKGNAQKILEYSRMIKFGKLRAGSVSPAERLAEKKKEKLAARTELKAKYTYRKIHLKHASQGEPIGSAASVEEPPINQELPETAECITKEKSEEEEPVSCAIKEYIENEEECPIHGQA